MVSFSDRPAISALAGIVRRLLEGALTAWAAVSVTFFALRIAAGDPLGGLLDRGLASQEQIERFRQAMGLDAPLLLQYLRFLGDFIRGDLGTSLYSQRPVSAIISEQFPATAQLALVGLLIALFFGLIIGVTAAWKEKHAIGRLANLLAGLATALPVAFTGILVLLFVRQSLRWLPSASVTPLQRLILPALVLGFASAGAIARVIRAGLSESMDEPYMLAAKARGIHGPLRLLWHGLKPVLPPAISLSALEAAFLLSGTVVTEMVFSRPGLGRLLVHSILQGDYPIAQGLVALAAVIYTITYVLADVIASLIDPRLRRMA
jgi:peptide/nickel transport system permease protein